MSALKEWLFLRHTHDFIVVLKEYDFRENAASTPNVHGVPVLGFEDDYFWRTICSRYHMVGEASFLKLTPSPYFEQFIFHGFTSVSLFGNFDFRCSSCVAEVTE